MLPTTPRRQPRSMCSSCSMPFSTTATRVSRGVTLTRISSVTTPLRATAGARTTGIAIAESCRSSFAVSCSGRPITPEKLPDRCSTKVSARALDARRRRPCPAIRRWRRRRRCASSSSAANLTSETDTVCASRPADTSDTAEITWCVRPDSARSMAAASSASRGLPNTSSSSTTSVSVPSTTADGFAITLSRPAPAFSRATRRTYSSAGSPGWRCSGTSRSSTPNSRPRRASSSRRRGDWEARYNILCKDNPR